MGNYGNRVIAPYSSYPNSNSYSPVKNTAYISKLNDKIEDLSFQLESKSKKRKELQVMNSVMSLLDTLASEKQKNERSATPAPVNTEMTHLLQSFQKQQDMMLQLMQNIAVKEEKTYKRSKKSSQGDTMVDKEYQRIAKDPEEIRKMLAELNFDDDGAEDYADKERKLKFNANLSDDEKMRIIKKIDKSKADRIKDNIQKTKGISRFRMVGIIVLFPIFLVSNLLEKRARVCKQSLKNMEESIGIYLDVAKSWVLKAMKTVLVSTINDNNLDLVLTNKESDVKSQIINAKVIKLQVRINGIFEGLENLTNEKEMQLPFRKFIDMYISDNTYMPSHLLCGFERSRIEINEFGGLMKQNDDKKRMMLCFFFITKVLVKQICLKPVEAGIPIIKGSKAVT